MGLRPLLAFFILTSACSPDPAPVEPPDDDGGESVDGATDGCVVALEQCNGMDDDCDGEVDDPPDSGGFTECSVAHGWHLCVSGECSATDLECAGGYGNCDGSAGNGCELELTSVENCGGCGRVCAAPQANVTCESGMCEVTGCQSGWGDCDVAIGNGCEANLSDGDHCGSCENACASSEPLCQASGGTLSCVSTCPANETACGTACVPTQTDPMHCGNCTTVCSFEHAPATCEAGGCVMGGCYTGWDDCDASSSNGCETSITTTTDCGACGVVCTLPNAVASCGGGECVVEACAPGFGDCNGLPVDGCETPLDDVENCGRCGNECLLVHATAACVSDACVIDACEANWGDCNGNPFDGCEASLETRNNCGGCGVACDFMNADETCAGGTCQFSACWTSHGDCDSNTSTNGCEQSLSTLTSCGGCGIACTLPNAVETCVTGSCNVVSCEAPYLDCDLSSGNGCETNSLTNVAHCSACGAACPDLPNTTETCVLGRCAVGGCTELRADCDLMPANGCEGTSIRTYTQISAGSNDACAIDSMNQLWCWGSSQVGGGARPRLIPGAWTQVSVGGYFACGVKTDTSLWCWGNNDYHRLGIAGGSAASTSTPVRVSVLLGWARVTAGDTVSCALRTNGEMWCWGASQTLFGGFEAAPAQEGVASDWARVAVGSDFICAIKTNGTLWCRGYGRDGQFGNGTNNNISRIMGLTQILTATNWADTVAGWNYTVSRKTDGSVWVTGGGSLSYTLVGNGYSKISTHPWAHHVCLRSTGGIARCWGSNANGELGNGTTTPSAVPVQVGTATTWTDVAVGNSFSCGIRGTEVSCWGASWGLGYPSATTDQYQPTHVCVP